MSRSWRARRSVHAAAMHAKLKREEARRAKGEPGSGAAPPAVSPGNRLEET